MKLGYACINSTLQAAGGITTNRGMRQKTFNEKGLDYVSELALQNCRDLVTIIKWNEEMGIKLFRMSSDLFPWATFYDFEELPVLELHHDNLFNTYYNDGKHRIGMVINLDTHNMSGSHWVALYANLHNNQVYFFDSVGKKPGKRIRKFVNKIVKYLYSKNNPNQKLNINNILNRIKNNKNSKIQQLNNIDIKYNYIQHQFDNSECGVYSINFILRLIDGESFENIITNITRDEAMNTNRLVYFR